ncbi:hypothetical protein [Mycobacterium tuberculosis]|uniref:hypothetical protein n=1 Tax=Mycobacterium tuberculosis TaxID=1773 RepID=UPI000459FECA|nr:hypothetical protein [Mycobacterium tuberculosis]KAP93800.1 hypothetical protein AJ23_02567 [Mycobacterium tuberculosis MD16568]
MTTKLRRARSVLATALTLPDAITGNPGDPRYPYRPEPPAPPPGGPPPGPPAQQPGDQP